MGVGLSLMGLGFKVLPSGNWAHGGRVLRVRCSDYAESGSARCWSRAL